MLSNPLLMLSAGSSNGCNPSPLAVARCQQVANGVLIFRAAQPMKERQRAGIGFCAARSIEFGFEVCGHGIVGASIGRGEPAGGIAPERSLRITFSQSSGFALTCVRDLQDRERGPQSSSGRCGR